MVIDLNEIAHIVQMALAPVFLLTGIAAFLSVLTARMSRIVDRGHLLSGLLNDGSNYDNHKDEIAALSQRLKYAHLSIVFCSISAVIICSVVILIFVGAFANIHFGLPVAILFSLSMVSLIIALVSFLLEVRYSFNSIKHGVKIL